MGCGRLVNSGPQTGLCQLKLTELNVNASHVNQGGDMVAVHSQHLLVHLQCVLELVLSLLHQT